MKRIAKSLVRALLAEQGWRIVRQSANNGPPLFLISLLIERLAFEQERPGAILQVGANDGVLADPVHHVITARNLPAILIEPLPDKFEELRRNYKDQPNVRFENVAISNRSGQATMFRISASAKHLPNWVQGAASFDRSVLMRLGNDPGLKGKRISPYIESLSVPVLSIAQILCKHSDIGSLMALQIDAEGHDFAVVKSAVEAGCLPPIINYEHKHLGFSDQFACRELLASHGYAFFSNDVDTLAYRGSP